MGDLYPEVDDAVPLTSLDTSGAVCIVYDVQAPGVTGGGRGELGSLFNNDTMLDVKQNSEEQQSYQRISAMEPGT